MAESHHSDRAPDRPPGAAPGLWRPVALLAAIVAVIAAAWFFEARAKLEQLGQWVEGLGPAAPAAFIVFRAGAAVAVLPGSVLTVAAGPLFGPVAGVFYVIVGKTLGACLSFLIARYFARDAVARWLAGKRRGGNLDEFVGRCGAPVVALARLIPVIPYNVQNYAFGLTRIRLVTYVAWSWICMVPGAVLVVTASCIIKEELTAASVPWGLVGALVASVAVMIGGAVYAALKLRA